MHTILAVARLAIKMTWRAAYGHEPLWTRFTLGWGFRAPLPLLKRACPRMVYRSSNEGSL